MHVVSDGTPWMRELCCTEATSPHIALTMCLALQCCREDRATDAADPIVKQWQTKELQPELCHRVCEEAAGGLFWHHHSDTLGWFTKHCPDHRHPKQAVSHQYLAWADKIRVAASHHLTENNCWEHHTAPDMFQLVQHVPVEVNIMRLGKSACCIGMP